MGNVMGYGRQALPEAPPQNAALPRKRDRSESDEDEKIQNEHLDTPQKKKLKSTSDYIYETLFVKGENSDVTIIALDKKWALHKLYLCQAHYFYSMFKGPWRESKEECINIEITDDNIDQEALAIAFGSLYRDDVTISANQVISVLAASTLVGLDGLIAQCVDVMKSSTSEASVCAFHQAALLYGQESVRKACQDWLEKNIMTKQTPTLLRDISSELMEAIVSSPNLFVMQVEMDVYSMLRKWLYLKINPSWEGKTKALSSEAEAFFKSQRSSILPGNHQGCCFLHSREGKPHESVFSKLRLVHVINDLSSTTIMERENIIPSNWLLPLYRHQWLQMLKVEQNQQTTSLQNIHKNVFEQRSMRCGRILQKEGQYCWRWTGYNFGFDLLVSVTNKMILFKRNALTQNCPNFVSLQERRTLVYRLRLVSLNTLGQTRCEKDTGIKQIQLGKDEEAFITALDSKLTFPLYVGCNLLIYSPQSAPDLAPADSCCRTSNGSPSVSSSAHHNGDNVRYDKQTSTL